MKKGWRSWIWKIPLILIFLSLFSVVFFRFVPPVVTPLMIMRWVEGQVNNQPVGISVRWRPLNKISPSLARAVITSEDQKFFQRSWF